MLVPELPASLLYTVLTDKAKVGLQAMPSVNATVACEGRFPLDEFLRVKRLLLLSHEPSAGTNDRSIQLK